MLIVVKSMFMSANSEAAQRPNASSAALDETYAENRGAFVSTPIEEMLITCPRRFAIIEGSTPRVRRTAPK